MSIQFVQPSFLWFLGFLAVPVIIHLFNFRRFRKILFTNVRFLKELKEETQSQSKLKHLLVLLSRLLAITCIVLAFAQPFIPKNKNQAVSGQNVVSIYVDNSYSMNLQGDDGSLLDEAKNKTRSIISAYPASTKFQLLTNEFKGEQQRALGKEEAMELTDKIKITSSSRSAEEVFIRQNDFFKQDQGENHTAFWMSDFQKNYFGQPFSGKDSSLQLNLVSLSTTSPSNVYVDSCWLNTPVVQLNVPAELSIKVVNDSKDAVEVPVKFYLNKTQKAVATVKVNAESEAVTTLNFTVSQPGWQQAMVSIDDNPVTFDDSYYLTFRIASKISVYHIGSSKNIYVSKLFENNDMINYSFALQSAVDFSQLRQANTVVLTDLKDLSSGMSQELTQFVKQGGTLMIFPDSMINPGGYSALAQQLNLEDYLAINGNEEKIGRLDFENNLFKNMFEKIDDNMNLPSVKLHYDLSNRLQSGSMKLMQLQSGGAFLNLVHSGTGKVYQFTSPAQTSAGGFVVHALFAPVLFKIALQSIPSVQPSFIAGKNDAYKLNVANTGDAVFHLINSDLKKDIIPDVKSSAGETVVMFHSLDDAGIYKLLLRDSTIAEIALNYDRAESAMKFCNDNDLMSIYNTSAFKSVDIIREKTSVFEKKLNEYNRGIPLWKYFVIAGLVFLLAETLLLKYYKV